MILEEINDYINKNSKPKKFRKKPVIIEPIQWNGKNNDSIITWCNGNASFDKENNELVIKTLEDGKNNTAKHAASINDWVIKGVHDEFYFCKPDIFKETYDKV